MSKASATSCAPVRAPYETTADTVLRTLISRVRETYTAWRLRRETRNQLSRLNDWTLRDIGLTRADIERHPQGIIDERERVLLKYKHRPRNGG